MMKRMPAEYCAGFARGIGICAILSLAWYNYKSSSPHKVKIKKEELA